MKRSVSTELTDEEYQALLKMIKIREISIEEFVKESILLQLCGSVESNVPEEKFEEINNQMEDNYKKIKKD